MYRFAFTIFLSAFLLFQVQPLIARYILPWFGGAPAVWTTCMLFFQVLLLGGYAYSHGINTWLKPKPQAILHTVLLLLSLLLLPIIPRESLKPEGTESPTLQILVLLLITIGLPYFLLSSTGPLIQAWFSRRFPSRSPYRLFALSNAGSLLALVSYPVVFERWFGSAQHAVYWSWGHALFVAACIWCAVSTCFLFNPKESTEEQTEHKPNFEEKPPETPQPFSMLMWLLLSLVPSILLLAATNQICQEVAVVPFLWVLPLSLYLLSFIICFDNPKWYNRTVFGSLMVLGVALAVYCIHKGTAVELPIQILGFSLALFACCMTCHGELARSRPHPKYLTLFYLFVSIGGALGGVFVVVFAPMMFVDYLELHVALIAAPLLTFIAIMLAKDWDSLRNISEVVPVCGMVIGGFLFYRYPDLFQENVSLRILFIVAIGFGILRFTRNSTDQIVNIAGKGVALIFVMVVICGITRSLFLHATNDDDTVVLKKRDFYGILKVLDNGTSYTLLNGRINHGFQYRDWDDREEPTSYYQPESGVGVAIALHPRRKQGKSLKIGVIGLGTGTIAAWVNENDDIVFYEINPVVKDIAYSSYFTYLKDAVVKPEKIVLGDARVKLTQQLKEGDVQKFDVLAVDAFSSDAIPRHLLTQECVEIYKKHLKPDGILAIHISNRYLNLEPVVYKLADLAGYQKFLVDFGDNDSFFDSDYDTRSSWALLTNNAEFYESEDFLPNIDDWGEQKEILWTDDFGSIFQIIDFDLPSISELLGLNKKEDDSDNSETSDNSDNSDYNPFDQQEF